MHNYLSILKLQFKNMFRSSKTESKKGAVAAAVVGMFILWALIAGMCVMLVYFMGSVFKAFELQSELITLIFIAGMTVELFFGIATVLSGLYFSKDTEFLLSLPVKSVTVFAAKFTVVYVTELAVSALILLPALITAGITMSMSWLFYLLVPLAVILTPIIPLLLAAIISIPVMYIASFLRNRGAVGSIAVLVLFGAFFTVYYILISKMQNFNPDSVDLNAVTRPVKIISNSVYPMYALARAMANTPVFGLNNAASAAVNLVIVLGCVAAMIAVAMLISAAVYKRGAAGQLEGAKSKRTVKVEYRSSGALKALMKKEWREILRTPTFALNCLLGIVVTPIIIVFIMYSFKTSLLRANETAPTASTDIGLATDIISYVLLAMICFMGVGTNSSPCTAISREGEKFYYMKILPVDYKTQLKAKVYVSVAISAVSCFLGNVVALIMVKNIVFFVCSTVYLMLFAYASAHFCMWFDVSSPKLKWTTPNEAVKHNRNAMISVFVNMLFGIALSAVGGVLFFVTLGSLQSVALAYLISWGVLITVTAVCAALARLLLYRTCEKKLNAIEA